MPRIVTFRDLLAWQKAMDLADRVYDITDRFPSRECFGLAHQMRKAAVSVPSNIAEGSRLRRAGYIYHLTIALGSHAELDTQSELATRRRFIQPMDHQALQIQIAEVGKLTHGLLRALHSSDGA